MSDDDAFRIDLSAIRARSKASSAKTLNAVDEVAERQGFLERPVLSRRGRKPSPRTGQLHAKVMPDVSQEIAAEARRRGVQQGVLIEEAWALYKRHRED